MTSDNYLKNCAFIKTMLMVIVILCHSCLYWYGSWFDSHPTLKS